MQLTWPDNKCCATGPDGTAGHRPFGFDGKFRHDARQRRDNCWRSGESGVEICIPARNTFSRMRSRRSSMRATRNDRERASDQLGVLVEICAK